MRKHLTTDTALCGPHAPSTKHSHRHEPPIRIRIPLLRPTPADLLIIHPLRDDRRFRIHLPRMRIPTRGDEEGEMHEQDDKAESGADGDDDASAVDGAGVGIRGPAAGENVAGDGGRVA